MTHRSILIVVLFSVSLAGFGCGAGISRFAAYRTVSRPMAPANTVLTLRVTSEQRSFRFDSRIDNQEVIGYVEDGLARELEAAGFVLENSPSDARAVVDVVIKQMDMGYKLFCWWYCIGYSASQTVATVQLRVTVTDQVSGTVYDREFADLQRTKSRKFWLYFIPIPLSIMEDEQKLMLVASQRVFAQVAAGIDEIFASRVAGGER